MPDQPKKIVFDEEARALLMKGILQLTDVVGATFGPLGANDTPDVELKNPYENMGACIGKEVAAKMKEFCGDGAKAALLVLNSLAEQGVKHIALGASPISINQGIKKAVHSIIALLEKQAIPIQTLEEIAITSGDEVISKRIASAFHQVGKEGVILFEEATSAQSSIEITQGLQFDYGYAHRLFSTHLHEPRILVIDQTVHSIQEILTFLKGQEILIFALDIDEDALSSLVVNHLQGSLKACAVKIPCKATLKDIAILTGATLISETEGISLRNADSTALGNAAKAFFTKDSTTLITNNESLEEQSSEKVAIIRVSAKEKEKYKDNLHLLRSAIKEGVLTGGGVALLRAAQAIETKLQLPTKEAVGACIVFEACRAPFCRLIQNCGLKPPAFLQDVLQREGHFGFNALSGKIENLFELGIRDPLKVIKSGLQLAASAAQSLLLSECLIDDDNEEEA